MACRATVLVFAGHDPGGGAGIQADIQAISAQGAHALPLITTLTVQDTRRVHRLVQVDVGLLREQFDALVADISIAAVKIGLLGSGETANVIADLLEILPDSPVILDPVLAAGGGGAEASAELVAVMRERILPRAMLLTPNTQEAQRLSGEQEPDRQARRLSAMGCRHLLITGTHDGHTRDVVNRYYADGEPAGIRQWPRLPGEYHGSGCTLASAIAGQLASGRSLADAVEQGQGYTWQALKDAYAVGHGQLIPNRQGRHALPS